MTWRGSNRGDLAPATIQTTEGYLAKPSLDDVARATATLTFGALPDVSLHERSGDPADAR